MNWKFRKYGYFAIAAVLAFASASFAQTTSMTLNGVGNGTVVGNVYVDPYTATIAGIGSKIPVICDDFSDNSYVGTTWTVNVTNLSAVSSGSPLFGQNQTLYDELAWLASDMLANYSPSPTSAQLAAQIADSFAIWQLTYGANSTTTESPGPFNPPFPINQSAIDTQISSAIASVGSFDTSGWEILTPLGAPYKGEPQEFLVHTPEASTILMLRADLLGVLALAFFFRRRTPQLTV